MPYPAARENPESTPCVRKLRGSSEGVREAAKNSVPRRSPLVENECHGPLPILAAPLGPGEDSFVRQLVASDLMGQVARRASCARPARRYATAMPQPVRAALFSDMGG